MCPVLLTWLIPSGSDFQFGKKDPNFKGFSRAGEQIFSTPQATPTKTDAVSEQEDDGMYKTEENDDIQFEPVVQMPDKVDVITGEEDEQVLYSQRVKLFRFDTSSSQWKERGVGVLKFLKNSVNGRLRVLMRREQVLKVCANHWITTTMNLKPLAGSDKAWMWMANDFSDGDAKLEQLAVKFKTPELAEEFKAKFEECQRLLLDIPLQTPHKLVDTGRTAHLIQKAEEMKSGLKDLKSVSDG
ncbi:E3 SUMO-protein ligase RanBP2 [Oryzias melastigma]|uniref:E3 SUMO-protein ligase RanBP2 n=1 Tax=Oryzias melastigma TaxID=30732 RepID=A0A834FQQ6_ORYME|nr:E3 SUMO-protein ligase RanBP2 [Oryzias melastigma]